MKLITKKIRRELEKKGDKPALKLFNPIGSATWLISEIDEDNIMFGLCDLGFGCPEFGYVSLAEIEALDLPLGMRIERDLYFEASKTLTEYAVDARSKGYIEA